VYVCFPVNAGAVMKRQLLSCFDGYVVRLRFCKGFTDKANCFVCVVTWIKLHATHAVRSVSEMLQKQPEECVMICKCVGQRSTMLAADVTSSSNDAPIAFFAARIVLVCRSCVYYSMWLLGHTVQYHLCTLY